MMSLLTKYKDREANFELLRIFSMFLIVLHHCNVHGIFRYWHSNSSMLHHINNFISFFLSSGGKIGVTLFVLLTGYFSCQQNFKLKKWFTIYLKTLFYSIFILCFYFLINSEQSQSIVIHSIFSFRQENYNFVTHWLLLYSFSPLLNIILKSCSPKNIQIYLVLGLILWVILPGFDRTMGYSRLLYFMYLYLLGGSLRLKLIVFHKKYLALLFLTIFSYTTITIMPTILFEDKLNLWNFLRIEELNTPYTLSASLWIFYIFKGLKMKSSFINWVASSMFGVYLLHDNKVVRPWLWHTFLKMDTSMNSPYFFIWSIIVSLGVISLYTIVDKLLLLIYFPLINYLESKISRIKLLQKYF